MVQTTHIRTTAQVIAWSPSALGVSVTSDRLGGPMDPNLFRLDWERTFEAVTAIVVLSFLVERALALVFENRRLLRLFDNSGMKEVIAFAVATWVCWYAQFDALSIIILAERISVPGIVLTGAVVAGGSKASVKLFQELMGVHSDAVKDKKTREERDKAAAAAVTS
jgi:hypothetical protein